MDKELFQLLAETAVKLQSESEPLIKTKQLSKSPTVRAYANVVNQGDDLFADILYKYLNGDVEVDEAVSKLNNREGALIKAGNYYQRLEGHHPIYQKLLANRLFQAEPEKALEVIKIIRDQLPSNMSPGTDPDKLIYTTRDLHGIIGHGGNFKSNTMGQINTEVTPKEIVDQLYPDLVDAVYRAGYLETNPAQQLMVEKAGEALGMPDPDKQSLKVRQSLAKQSKTFPILPSQLEGVPEATARVVPPDTGNVGRLGITKLSDVYDLGKARGGLNIGATLPVPIPTGSQLRQNALGVGAGAVTGAITPESAYAAGKGDWRTAAVEGVKAATTGAVVGGATQAALTSLMPRAAAALTSGPAAPLVAGVSAGLALQDAAQAFRAGQSGRSIPLQRKIEQTQQAKRREQDVAKFRAAMPGPASNRRMQANLSGNLSPQQIESFRAGGGNAAMMRDGLSVQQVIERGSSLRLKKIVNSTIRDQV
jgi:hypothetical protein